MVAAALRGFALGWSGARLGNILIRSAERNLERRLAELARLDVLDGVDVGRL